jgi:hypothetical protein
MRSPFSTYAVSILTLWGPILISCAHPHPATSHSFPVVLATYGPATGDVLRDYRFDFFNNMLQHAPMLQRRG